MSRNVEGAFRYQTIMSLSPPASFGKDEGSDVKEAASAEEIDELESNTNILVEVRGSEDGESAGEERRSSAVPQPKVSRSICCRRLTECYSVIDVCQCGRDRGALLVRTTKNAPSAETIIVRACGTKSRGSKGRRRNESGPSSPKRRERVHRVRRDDRS